MVEILRIFLTIFSVYRLASLFSSEEGPYLPFIYRDSRQTGIFRWLRLRAGGEKYSYEYDEQGHLHTEVATNLGRGVSCPLCVGGYVTLFILILFYFPNFLTNFLLLWLGVWGVQVFLENLTADNAIEDAIDHVADSLEK